LPKLNSIAFASETWMHQYTSIPYQVAGEKDLQAMPQMYAIVVVYSLDGLCGADLLTSSGAPAGGWK